MDSGTEAGSSVLRSSNPLASRGEISGSPGVRPSPVAASPKLPSASGLFRVGGTSNFAATGDGRTPGLRVCRAAFSESASGSATSGLLPRAVAIPLVRWTDLGVRERGLQFAVPAASS